jgi:hypothetical protein
MANENKALYIPHEIMSITDLNLTEKGLLAEIEFLDRQGECFASNEHFSNRLGLTKWHVSKIIASLKQKGYVHSKIFYKKGTKEIEKRIIKAKCLCHQKYNCEERLTTYCENDNTLLSKEQVGSNDNIIPYPTKLVESRNYPIEEMTTLPIAEITIPPCDNHKTLLSKEQDTYCENDKDNLQSFNKHINKQTNYKNIKPKPQQIRDEFDCLWKEYPNKKGKENASNTYKRLRENNKVTFETVKKGIEMYVEYIKFHGIDKTKIKHGSTWFNQHGWEDEYEEADFKNKHQYSKFTQIMLDEMEDPDQFLMDIGVSEFEPRRNRKIVSDD